MRKQSDKPLLMAVAFFAVMTLFGVVSSQAQVNLLDPIHSPDTNPLLATTGPNTIGKGRLQLNASGFWYSFSQDREEYPAIIDKSGNGNSYMVHDSYRELGGNVGLRYGIGSRFELTAGLTAAHERDFFTFSTGVHKDTVSTLVPSLGMKMMLYEGGHGWVPQVSAVTRLDMPLLSVGNEGFELKNAGELVLGFQFRNHLGRRWALDYDVSYRLNANRPVGRDVVYAMQRDNPFQFHFMARWLATDRLMVSAGMENLGGVAEVMWQATPDLQLKAQAGLAAGVGFRTGMLETNALLGVNWMLK